MLTKLSACPLDCPDTCTLTVQVDAAGERLLSVEGDERNPMTASTICGKVRRLADRVHSPLRLGTPWRRVGGTKVAGSFPRDFEPCSWDAAFDTIATRLAAVRDEHGGEAILPVSYGGSNGVLTEGLVDERLWRRLGASRLHRNVCATPSGAAFLGLYGKMPGADLRDHEHADLILVWGCNPHASGMHYVAIVQRAQERGAKLVVIDPRSTALAKRADLHLAPKPGTDLVVALALHRELFANGWQDAEFMAKHTSGGDELRAMADAWSLERAAEESGIPAASLAELAGMYAKSRVPVIRQGWGLERTRHGASACAAILALPAVAGKFGVRGAGFTCSMGGAAALVLDEAIAAEPLSTREVELNQVAAALNEPGRVFATFVYNCNPLATLPDQNALAQGFARADLFTVVFEQVANDSVDVADIVLPATTFIEHEELRKGYGAGYITHAQAALKPYGEARANAPVFAELLERMNLERSGDLKTPTALAEKIVATSPLTTAQRQTLRATGGVSSTFESEGGHAPIPFVDHLPRTSDERVHLMPASMPGLYRYDPPTETLPLTLISPAHIRMTTSTFGEALDGVQGLVMHPEDLAARGLKEGERVRVYNALGEVHTLAITHREGPRPGTVCMPKGLWRKHTFNGQTSNALIPDHLSDFGRGACYNDARVEVERL